MSHTAPEITHYRNKKNVYLLCTSRKGMWGDWRHTRSHS